MDLSKLKFAYKSGNNRAGPKATYYCHSCDLDLLGEEEVCFVAAGTRYANGEVSRCPRCGEDNSVEWDDDDF